LQKPSAKTIAIEIRINREENNCFIVSLGFIVNISFRYSLQI